MSSTAVSAGRVGTVAASTYLPHAASVPIGFVIASTGTLAEAGKLALPLAAFYHFVGDIVVLANSFRLFRFGESFVSAEAEQQQSAPRRRAASLRNLQPAGA